MCSNHTRQTSHLDVCQVRRRFNGLSISNNQEIGCSDVLAGRLAVVEREKQKIQLDTSCVSMDSVNVNMASISVGIKRVFVDPENALYGDMQRTRKILKTCSARLGSRGMLTVCTLNMINPPESC